MSTSRRDWRERQYLGELIKAVCFNPGTIDPRSYDKSVIIAAKSIHQHFGQIHEDLWFTAFRRSASEYILHEDLDAVGKNRRRHCRQPQALSPIAQLELSPIAQPKLSPPPSHPPHSQVSHHHRVSIMNVEEYHSHSIRSIAI